MAAAHDLQISASPGGTPLRPDQKRFNTLIRQIERARAKLAAWRDAIPLYAQAHAQVIVPLARTALTVHRQWTFALDRLLDQPGWTKAERATLRELICENAAELLDAAEEDDAELKALFDKHAEVDFDTEQREMRLALADMAQAVTGVDLGDLDDITSDDELFERMQAGLAEQAAREEAAQESAPPARARRGKTKTAVQQRREAEAQLATQSVREVFRKLASALHPDRETDAAQRAAKTALMQKVNQAYAASDLLALLELQLQIEQVDAAHIADAGAQRLKHYNKVLAEQLGELKAEIERMEMGFCFDFGIEPGWATDPAKLLGLIELQAADLRKELALQRRELRTLDDKAATKRWLKREQRRLREEEAFDRSFF
jgi:hypothetical protein